MNGLIKGKGWEIGKPSSLAREIFWLSSPAVIRLNRAFPCRSEPRKYGSCGTFSLPIPHVRGDFLYLTKKKGKDYKEKLLCSFPLHIHAFSLFPHSFSHVCIFSRSSFQPCCILQESHHLNETWGYCSKRFPRKGRKKAFLAGSSAGWHARVRIIIALLLLPVFWCATLI